MGVVGPGVVLAGRLLGRFVRAGAAGYDVLVGHQPIRDGRTSTVGVRCGLTARLAGLGLGTGLVLVVPFVVPAVVSPLIPTVVSPVLPPIVPPVNTPLLPPVVLPVNTPLLPPVFLPVNTPLLTLALAPLLSAQLLQTASQTLLHHGLHRRTVHELVVLLEEGLEVRVGALAVTTLHLRGKAVRVVVDVLGNLVGLELGGVQVLVVGALDAKLLAVGLELVPLGLALVVELVELTLVDGLVAGPLDQLVGGALRPGARDLSVGLELGGSVPLVHGGGVSGGSGSGRLGEALAVAKIDAASHNVVVVAAVYDVGAAHVVFIILQHSHETNWVKRYLPVHEAGLAESNVDGPKVVPGHGVEGVEVALHHAAVGHAHHDFLPLAQRQSITRRH
ncbi:glycoside hydrolase family 18 protein [Babesia caballi]|uniref:Glycoside hydrolase family 18 protein n=1 Tax=Babesia caballi TaxID=5871 RepID=A0AAV4LP86_BABCB|nr:glycoside hydrolase family 18 protein [Babesia caballi]